MSEPTSHEILDIEVTPDQPVEHVPADVLRSGLESEEDRVRRHAARVAAALAANDVETVTEVVPTLIERLDDDARVVVSKSAIALSIVAEEHPSELEDAVPALVDLLVDDLSLVRIFGARALGHLSLEHPEYLLGTEETLVDALGMEVVVPIDREKLREEAPTAENFETFDQYNIEEERRQIAARGIAANLLVEVAELDPERLVPHVEAFVAALEDTRPTVVLASLDVLGTIARVDADAVVPAVERACELLETPDERIGAAAITVLGFASDPRAIDPLRSLAEDDDRDQDLRELADETATFVEQATA